MDRIRDVIDMSRLKREDQALALEAINDMRRYLYLNGMTASIIIVDEYVEQNGKENR